MRRGAVVPFLEQRLRGLNVAVSAEAFLKAVVQVSELLVEREAQEYEFAHLSFQSYLAALEIQRTRQEKLLLENYATPFWKETILLYGSQSRNPESLIQGLCSQNPEGIISKSAIDLAYSILQETHRQLDSTVTDQVESLRFAASQIESLRSQVQDLRFKDLESFLQKGEWKKADHETYRLMITTVGKEEGQGFMREELLNFPCEELLTIDGLWLKYSQGRYGFSIQKEIYVRCGGILDGSDPTGDVWEKFTSAVGWYVDNDWFSDMRWDGIGVLGHLPWALYIVDARFYISSRGIRRVSGWGYFSLASRLVKCNPSGLSAI